jgi:hypothetical protein
VKLSPFIPPVRDGASRNLIIIFRYMPLDPAYKAVLARHETGQSGTQELTKRRNKILIS